MLSITPILSQIHSLHDTRSSTIYSYCMFAPDSAPMNINFPALHTETHLELLERKLKQAITNRPKTKIFGAGRSRRLLLDDSDHAANPRVLETPSIRSLRVELMGERAKQEAPLFESAWNEYRDALRRLPPDNLLDRENAEREYDRVRNKILFDILTDIDRICYSAELERNGAPSLPDGEGIVSAEQQLRGLAKVTRAFGEQIRNVRTRIKNQDIWGIATKRFEDVVRSTSQGVARGALGFLDRVQTEYIPDLVASNKREIENIQADYQADLQRHLEVDAFESELVESIRDSGDMRGRIWYTALLGLHKIGAVIINKSTDLMQWDRLRRIQSKTSKIQFLEGELQNYVSRLSDEVRSHESGEGDARLAGSMMQWLGRRANMVGSAIEHIEEKLIHDPEYTQRALLGAALVAPMAVTNPMYLLLYPVKWQIDSAFAIGEVMAGSNTIPSRSNQMGHYILNTIAGFVPGYANEWRQVGATRRRERMDTMAENILAGVDSGDNSLRIGKDLELLRRYREGDSRLDRIRQKLRTGLLYAFNIQYIMNHGGVLFRGR